MKVLSGDEDIVVAGDDLLTSLYYMCKYNPDDIEEGLFKSDILMIVSDYMNSSTIPLTIHRHTRLFLQGFSQLKEQMFLI